MASDPWSAYEHIERLDHICEIVLKSGVSPKQLRECSKKSVQQGRSSSDARSVPLVREHSTRARTPLVGFFQHSLDGEHGRQYSSRFA